MPQQNIPVPWRRAVCAILKKGGSSTIKWTIDCERRYSEDFPSDWQLDAHDELIKHLMQPSVTGCLRDMGPGETWEFLYMHKKRNAYGKITLSKDQKKILLLSAHLPTKEGLSCDRD